MPIAALAGEALRLEPWTLSSILPVQAFDAEAYEYHFAATIAAKLAIADDLARPLAKLAPAERAFIDQVLAETLNRNVVLARVRDYFRNKQSEDDHAG